MKKETRKTKYIGIDIGKRKCFVCIKNYDGKILHQTSYDNTVYEAKQFIKSLPKARYTAVCESTGNMWIKTFNVFEDHGIPIVLANPFKTKAIASARIKTDKLDAQILADLLRADLIPTCHVPDMSVRHQKEILRRRITLVMQRTQVSNRLSSLLDRHDIVLSAQKINSKKNLKQLNDMSFDSTYDTYLIKQSIRHIRYLNDDIDEIEDSIADIASKNKYAKLIMSLTGFDVFGASLIALEIDDILRFKTPAQLVSWMGLCPTVYQSGNTIRHGKMRRDVNPYVKWMMFQAAKTAAIHDTRMAQIYETSSKSHPYGVAISKVANKYGRIIWFMLRDNKPYIQRKTKLYEKKLFCLKQ